MKPRVVVIGASAGGVKALRELAAGLPADFPAVVLVVLHTTPDRPSSLGEILSKSGQLDAATAADGERLTPGHIRVAPSDRHLMVEDGTMRLASSATENHHRPAIDPLFRSAAQAYGRGVIGILLSGTLDDGTAGMIAIKEHGGTTIVQDPEDSEFPGMALNAIRYATIDHVVPVAGMPALLRTLLDRMPVTEDGGGGAGGTARRGGAWVRADRPRAGAPRGHPGVAGRPRAPRTTL